MYIQYITYSFSIAIRLLVVVHKTLPNKRILKKIQCPSKKSPPL
jgi:hypothetical protein